jgi:hypothetical protein
MGLDIVLCGLFFIFACALVASVVEIKEAK